MNVNGIHLTVNEVARVFDLKVETAHERIRKRGKKIARFEAWLFTAMPKELAMRTRHQKDQTP